MADYDQYEDEFGDDAEGRPAAPIPVIPLPPAAELKLRDSAIYCVACTHQFAVPHDDIDMVPHEQKDKGKSFLITNMSSLEGWDTEQDERGYIKCGNCAYCIGRQMSGNFTHRAELYSSQIMYKDPRNNYCSFIGHQGSRKVCAKYHMHGSRCPGPKQQAKTKNICHDVHLCPASYDMLGHNVTLDNVDIRVIGGSWMLPKQMVYR